MMRKTVHLIATEDAGWLLPLFSDSIVRWARKRMAHFDLDRSGQDRAWPCFSGRSMSTARSPVPELAERLTAAGFDAAQEIKVLLWLLATLEGELCLGRTAAGRPGWCGPRTGIGAHDRRPREDALAELARRYIRAYGPATERDMARWRACHCATAGSGSSGSRPS